MTISQQLKEARIAAGKEIEEIASALNIRKKYLIALEEGDFDVIPGRVYVKGYFRLYARYLGIAIKPGKTNATKQSITLPYKIPIAKKVQNYLIILTIILLILTVVVYQLITSDLGTLQ